MMPEGYANPEANDIRFQYDVIRNLAESVREQSKVMAGIQSTQVSMLERLAKIEANRINEDVATLSSRLDTALEKIDELEKDRDIREGGVRSRRAVQSYWGIITSAASALGVVFWILLRAAGVVHLPSDEQKPPIVVPVRVPNEPATMPVETSHE